MNPSGSCIARLAATAASLAFLFTSSSAMAVAPKDILFSAIRNGSASEVLTGPVAQNWQAKSQSTSPVQMSAKVVKRFKQPECARLSVTMHQDNVPKKDGGTAPLEFTYELNLCTDGLPPADSVDWSKSPQQAPSASPEQIK